MVKTSDIIWQDTQHQMLFQIIDDLKSDHPPGQVVQRLYYYIESHFSLEEEYMRLLDYPDYEKHLDAHNKFRQEIQHMVDNCPISSIERTALSTYLHQWLNLHVMGIDKELEEFVLASKRK